MLVWLWEAAVYMMYSLDTVSTGSRGWPGTHSRKLTST